MIIQVTTEYELDADEVVKQYPSLYRSFALSNREDPEGFVELLFSDHFSPEATREFLENFGRSDYTEVNYVG